MRTRCGLRLTPVHCSIRAAASLAEAGGRDWNSRIMELQCCAGSLVG
ncbi:MAG: hypothetical protein LBQ54_14565 [Planctomycetaceae bacterium]|nr:hypothetical protein [Planctomycetaceae bacterium]